MNRAALLWQWRHCGTFMYGSVSLQKIRLEKNLKEVSRQALDGFIYREDMDLFAIFDIRAGMNTVKKDRSTEVSIPEYPMICFQTCNWWEDLTMTH